MVVASLVDLGDPLGAVTHLLTRLLTHFVSSGRDDLLAVLNRYLFTTVDSSHPGMPAFTSNPVLVHLNGGLIAAADILLTAVIAFTALRSMLERSMHSLYSLRVMLPRAMVAIVLMHGSLLFSQMAIDLNNALGHVALTLADTVPPDAMPWSDVLAQGAVQRLDVTQDLFQAVFVIFLVIALVILVLAYVVRTALLNILVVVAPLAALCMILPETRGYARTWVRLFTVAVFMQATQLIVLRVATATAFDKGAGLGSILYAIATLFIMLKVPGALSTAAHLETKAKTLSHGLERSVKKVLFPHHATHRSAA